MIELVKQKGIKATLLELSEALVDLGNEMSCLPADTAAYNSLAADLESLIVDYTTLP